MHCLRDAIAVNRFIANESSLSLINLIANRLESLAEFEELPLSALANFHIAGPEDTLEAVSQAIGLTLPDTPIDLCEQHPDWFELTIIVGDDGFGHVVYIPTNTQDKMLYNFCCRHSSPPPEMPT